MKESTPHELKEIRTTRKRNIKREMIIKIAQTAFIEHGYENTMVDQVALQAGYTKATLYKYFESKEDLFTGVLSKIYMEMFDTMQKFIEKPRTSSGLRTVGDAYLDFVTKFPGEASLLDSGRCVTINRTIILKEEKNQPLTESEIEFRNNESKVGMLVMDLLSQTMKESGVTGKIEPIKIVKILSAFMLVIRELIRRGNVGGQSEQEIRSTLSVLFTIIEQGVKYYEKN